MLDRQTCYNTTAPPNCISTPLTSAISQIDTYETLDGVQQHGSTAKYNSSGLLTEQDDYDFGGTAGRGGLLRKEVKHYQNAGNRIVLSDDATLDGNGNELSQTTYGYDETTGSGHAALQPTSGLPQHSTGLASQRGNLTTVSQWVNTLGASVNTAYSYDDSGQILTKQDARGNTTSYSYDPSTKAAFLTHVSYPSPGNGNNAVIATGAQYDAASGVLQSSTDANGKVTTYKYYDRLLRPLEVDFPDGGQTTYSYPSATETSVSRLQQGNNYITTVYDADGYGRQSQVTLKNSTAGDSVVNYTYYPNGPIYTVTNPHRSSSSPTDGTTTYVYDALGRPTSLIFPDVATQGWTTIGNTITTKDAAGNQWKHTTDGLGRLTQVLEPGSASQSPATETDYIYSGFTLTVAQPGVSGETPRSTRSFTSDSLGRTVSVTAPENGTTGYSYDANGNLTLLTDARGITTNYTYDALNRLTNKQSGGGSGVPGFNYTYGYDSTASVVNGIGHLVWATNSVNADELFSYDSMGRMNWQASWTPSSPNHTGIITAANYDLAGNITDLVYPDGRHITQSWNTAGQLTQIADNSTGYQYLTPNTSYWPSGTPQSIFLGNGLAIGYHQNNRLQVDEIRDIRIGTGAPGSYSSNYLFSDKHLCFGPATAPLSSSIAGCPTLANANNGNIWQIQDSLNAGHTQTFSYDPLSRLTSLASANGSMQQTYAYDSFGNVLQNGSFNAAATSKNQMLGYSYDLAGNLLSNGFTSMTWNAENRLTAVSGGAYTYDANGVRIRKDVGNDWTEYVHFNGQALAEKNSDGTWSDYIFANGQRIARADNSDIRIHMSGTNCSNCGNSPNMYSGVTSLTAANGYTIRNGDVLAWRQYQDGSTTGGLFLYFTDHTDGLAAQDTDGQLIDQDTTMNSWHMRTVDLSQFAGKTIQLIDPFQWTNAPAGNWDIYYGDIVLVSTDGTSIPIYNRTMTSLSVATNPTVSNFSAITEKVVAYSPIDTTYYHADQISSTHLQTSYAGWPLSSDTYAPFGGEATPPTDANHYKFTGLERDQESGFDHAMFRQYSSTMGRWLSPGPLYGQLRSQ